MSITNYNFATRISKAILAGEKQMLLEDGSVLEIPADQKAGTFYQQQAYADQKAIKIVDELMIKNRKNE